MTARAIILFKTGPIEIDVDASADSPFTHDILGGTPTFVGTWDHVHMLTRRHPVKDGQPVPKSMLPSHNIETGPLIEPLLVTKLSPSFEVVDLTLKEYMQLVSSD